MWAGMDARTRSGKVLGYVNDVEFDLKTGRAKTFDIGDGGMARALVGSFEIPAEMVIGYSTADQFMVVSDDAEVLAVDGGVAAKAGEAWASAKVKGAEIGHKAGAAASEAVDKGSFQVGRLIGKAKRAIADATAEEPQPADPAEIPAADVSVSAPTGTLRASEGGARRQRRARDLRPGTPNDCGPNGRCRPQGGRARQAQGQEADGGPEGRRQEEGRPGQQRRRPHGRQGPRPHGQDVRLLQGGV